MIAQAGRIGIINRRVQINNIWSSLPSNLGFVHTWKREYRTSLMMMVDTGASENRGPVVDKHPEKDEDGGYTSGGWKRSEWIRLNKAYFYLFKVMLLNCYSVLMKMTRTQCFDLVISPSLLNYGFQ